jgi:hypothetical protein
MLINHKKSAIVAFNFGPALVPPASRFPVATSYHYLGLYLDNQLSIGHHLNNIARKVSYVTNQLTCIRLLKNAKLNNNLYKIIIMPLYRLAFSLFNKLKPPEQQQLILSIKRTYKLFMCFPINTSDKILNSLLGNTTTMLKYSQALITYTTKKRYDPQSALPP